ncbi:hypothetical protein AU476_15040 [Cupriavidus sp. UYMSc13B]|nr:hypothetical protein AU476_15040 [Cupriavidus sp. UYMSc13B]
MGLTPLIAVAAPPTAQAEIAHLFDYLSGSACQFNRNGTWYSGKEAVEHLKKKYSYLDDRGAITSTEQFIELGASRSSVSGKPYMVRCPSTEPVVSAVWLKSELARYRKAMGK